MKKIMLFVLCAVSAISAAIALVGCKEEHTHLFTEQKVEEQYLASEVTCTESAKYYYSCSCGEKGTETFASGNALGHSFTNYVSDNNATCTQDGTKTATCDRCTEKDTIADENSKLTHIEGELKYDIKQGSDLSSATIKESVYCKLCKELIEVNSYDINLPSKTFSYDGQKHSLTLEGDKLPERIEPVFDNNEQAAAGDYSVTVGFIDKETQTVFATILTAELKINKDGKYHEVVFAYDDVATANVSIAVKHGEKLSESQYPELPQKRGYTVKWVFDGTEIVDDMTISILYTPIKYKITYVLDDASNNPRNPYTYTFESPAITLYAPENSAGLSFQGWYTSPNFEASSRVSTIASGTTGDLTFYAYFLKYKVEAADGFTFDYKSYDYPALTQTVSSTKNTILLSTTIQVSKGCTWTLSRDIEGADIIKTKNMSLTEGHNIAYITVWYGDDYNLVYYLDVYKLGHRTYSFVADGVTVYPETTVEEQTYVSAPTAPEKPGYTFNGWYALSVNPEDIDLSSLIPDKPVTFPYRLDYDTKFLAIFKPNVYTATYDENGGKPLAQKTENITFDTPFTPVEPERDGYTFIGWQDGEGSVFKTLPQWKYLASETFTAQWELNTYSITYVLNGGINPENTVYEYTIEDETIELLAPSRKGYDFCGWFVDADFKKQVTEIAHGSFENKKFYAKWTPIVYEITYVLDGGENDESNPTTYTIESEDITLANPTKTGYMFNGWFDNFEFSGSQVKTIKHGSMGDVVLYAKFTANTYTITYSNVKRSYNYSSSQYSYSYSAASTYTQTVTYDEPFTLIDFDRTGYTKTGWYNGEELFVDGVWSLPNNVTLTADWNIVTYTISYELNGGENATGNPTTYTVETSTITLKNPTGKHSFTGWYKNIELTQKITTIPKGSYGNVTLYAGWQHVASGDWIIDKEPTCTNTGLKHKICSGCGENCSYTAIAKVPDAHARYEVIENVIEATCIAKGSYDKVEYCSECLTELSRVKIICDMVDHVWNGDGKCKNCGCDYVSQGLAYEVNSDDNGYVLTGIGTCTDSNLVIPSSYNGLPVTSIGYSAFRSCSGLTSVTIPDSVTSIGNSAFRGCSGLTSVVWNAENCTSSSPAFENCSNLTTVIIGENVKRIPSYVFYGCSGLTSVTIPDSVTAIGSYAFAYCSGLTSMTIPDSVTSIGDSAFYQCSGLENIYYTGTIANWCKISGLDNIMSSSRSLYIGSLYIDGKKIEGELIIPDGVTSIGNSAFYGCSGLTSVTIPDSVTSIGRSAFRGCFRLTSITIPDSVTSIGDFAFYQCSGLENIYYAGSIANWCKISGLYYVMSSSRSLYIDGKKIEGELIIPDGVTSIGDSAFEGCIGLTSITIPDSVTSIGKFAFSGCNGLTSITIPDSVTSIDDYAFSGCSGLTSVTIPDSVTSIGYPAFRGCSELTSVVWNAENCTTAGSRGTPTFENCNNLTRVTIGENVKTIPDYAFSGCSGLTSVTIPDSVTSIGEDAFYGCYKLVEVINNSSLNITKSSSSNGYVAYYALNVKKGGSSDIINQDGYLFYTYAETNYLLGYVGTDTDLVLSDSYNGNNYEIYKYAFYYCSGLTSVTIPDGVTSIGNYAFSGCRGLTSVTIPDSVTSIGGDAFRDCNNLKYNEYGNALYLGNTKSPYIVLVKAKTNSISSCAINNKTKFIGNSAFEGCIGLENIYYAGSIANWCKISGLYNVMSSSRSLYIDGKKIEGELIIPDGVTSINQYAFYGCSRLTSVTIPDSVTSIGRSAFRGCIGLTSITIPNSVTSIGGYAFENCYKLVEVINNSSLEITEGDSGNGYVAYYALNVKKGGNSDIINQDGYLFYTYAETNYLLGYVGTDTDLVLSDSYNGNNYEIYKYAFYYCSGLTSVTIPDGVTSIGNYAFSGCRGLTSVTIGKGVTSIGYWAFSGCSGLTSVTIGKGVTSIGFGAFSGCSGLTCITIPDSVTTIDQWAFYYCSGLTTIRFNGTKAQWNAISKESDWDYNTGKYTIYCTDGNIAK